MPTKAKATPRKGDTMFTPTLFRTDFGALDTLDPGWGRDRPRRAGLAPLVLSIVIGVGLGSLMYDVLTMSEKPSAETPPAVHTVELPSGKVLHITREPGESDQEFVKKVQAAMKGVGA